MLKQVFGDMPRTYATYANAEKALHKTVEKLGGTDETLAYIIAATPDGRFYPVFIPTTVQLQMAVTLSHNGVACVRR